jgi:hypothetical protein
MTQPQQFGFGFDQMYEEKRTSHLPSTLAEAIPVYRDLIDRHHAAMMVGDEKTVLQLRNEARDLAHKLDPENHGIHSGPDASGYQLERATAAPEGTIPKWGQTGYYLVDVNGIKVRIEQDGMLGIGSMSMFWPSFAAHAVDYEKPFLSETGYRSFMGPRVEVMTGIAPDQFATEVMKSYLAGECKGKPRKIQQTYVEREMERRAEKTNPQKQEQEL